MNAPVPTATCACGSPERTSHEHSPRECHRIDLLDRLRAHQHGNDMDLETARTVLKTAATTLETATALRRVFERIAELEAIELRIIERGVSDPDPAVQRLLVWLRTGVSLVCEITDDAASGPCGEPAVARWIDGATDETHYTCAQHAELAEGHYERRPL